MLGGQTAKKSLIGLEGKLMTPCWYSILYSLPFIAANTSSPSRTHEGLPLDTCVPSRKTENPGKPALCICSKSTCFRSSGNGWAPIGPNFTTPMHKSLPQEYGIIT